MALTLFEVGRSLARAGHELAETLLCRGLDDAEEVGYQPDQLAELEEIVQRLLTEG